jgi:catechol 2,3-dioxygenase-like lactoylglutathione lyase family enzyme
MALTSLNHVTIATPDLEGTRDFYIDVLGMYVGPRPDLGFPGYWLYCGNIPVVHLVPEKDDMSTNPSAHTGNFDHVAFAAEDFDGIRKHLAARGISYREQVVAGGRIRQLFFPDPNKVMIELNFQ